MKLFAFLVATALFVGSFLLFGYAFTIDVDPWRAIVFAAGIAAVALSLAIPFHLLEKFD